MENNWTQEEEEEWDVLTKHQYPPYEMGQWDCLAGYPFPEPPPDYTPEQVFQWQQGWVAKKLGLLQKAKNMKNYIELDEDQIILLWEKLQLLPGIRVADGSQRFDTVEYRYEGKTYHAIFGGYVDDECYDWQTPFAIQELK